MKRQLKTDIYGVIGLGRFGTALVKTLAEAGKEVIAIDKNEEKVKAVRRYTDYAFVVDNLSEDALKETGMQNCGTLTICIGERIDISILTTMLVTKLGVPHVISKAASEVHGEVLKQLGAEVVYPEADMAVRIGKRREVRDRAQTFAEANLRRGGADGLGFAEQALADVEEINRLLEDELRFRRTAPSGANRPVVLNVRDFGAVGDGKADD